MNYSLDPKANWWNALAAKVHTEVLRYVRVIDQQQSWLFQKFVRLEALYDTNPRPTSYIDNVKNDGRIIENVIASNVDTVAASITATDVRARVMTDDGDWSDQRKARHLEWYCEGIAKLLEVSEKCRTGFKAGAAVKGTGLNKVGIDRWNRIRVDPVMVDDVVVDEREVRNGQPPRQLHYRTIIDREELSAQFPDFKIEIERAQINTSNGSNWRLWAGYRPLERNEVMTIESWRLPIGKRGADGYKAGRHTICIDGADLLDEEWHKEIFPFAKVVWSQPITGWYGISLAERIAGHQRALNRRNLQIERQLDQGAFLTTFVSVADASLAVRSVNQVGSISVYKGQEPKTVIPPAVSPETYQSRNDIKASAYEESGVSRMAAQSVKPAGIDSGVALREYRDQTTQRFAIQEKAFEQFYLDTIWLILDCCKDLGDSAPKIMRRTKFGSKQIEWSDVDMTELRIQLVAASTLSRTPAGREQTVVEWAQAGIISQDEARRLIQHPDLERAMSLYTEAIENIEHCIEEIADGAVLMPEPFQDLKLLTWRGTMYYLMWSDLSAPEDVLENLRAYIVQAAAILNPPQPPQPAVQPGMAPGAPMGAPGPMPPGMPGAAPPGMGPPGGPPMQSPTAQFSPQAMQVLPS